MLVYIYTCSDIYTVNQMLLYSLECPLILFTLILCTWKPTSQSSPSSPSQRYRLLNGTMTLDPPMQPRPTASALKPQTPQTGSPTCCRQPHLRARPAQYRSLIHCEECTESPWQARKEQLYATGDWRRQPLLRMIIVNSERTACITT